MRFSDSFLDDIRARVPISSVVGRRVAWDRRKSRPSRGDYWACCPFHGEKSASFHCEDAKGRYHCFGCGASGDIFRFLTELDGLDFKDAVERLAAEAGLALPAADPRAEEREKRRASLYEVMEMAAAFFEATLRAPEGGPARSYLQRRRILPESQKRFRLGFATSSRNALKEHLALKGVGLEAMVEAGLVVKADDNPVGFDRFRDRVMFPIHDLRGRIVGFGGRAMSADAQAKYLNSPETPLFQKGSLLYRHAEARNAARATGTVIVVEGYVDVIAMATAGFEHTVAPLGTALTERQLQLLWAMAAEPILCFDGDEAGLRAAARMIDIALPLLQPGRSLRFALLPEGQDPDDLLASAGRAAMEEVLAAALPLSQMVWTRETEGVAFDTPERKAALRKRLSDLTGTIGDAAVRTYYAEEFQRRIAELFRPPEPAFSQPRREWQPRNAGAGGFRGRPGDRFEPPRPIVVSDSLHRSTRGRARRGLPVREAILVLTMANHPAILHEQFDAFAALELSDPQLDSLRGLILEVAASDPAIHASGMRRILEERGAGPLLDRLGSLAERSGHAQVLPAADDGDAAQRWLQAMTLHRKARTLHKELKEAEQALAADPTEENLARMIEIQNQLTSADGTEAMV